jgi:hypothetical protein
MVGSSGVAGNHHDGGGILTGSGVALRNEGSVATQEPLKILSIHFFRRFCAGDLPPCSIPFAIQIRG